MPLPLARSRIVFYIFISMLHLSSAIQPVCSAGIYGIPNYRDCLSAWRSMPFALEPGDDIRSQSYELWSEPQYLLPPFTAVNNRYKPQPINQVPKIWRYSMLIRLLLLERFVLRTFWSAIAIACHALISGVSRHMPPCIHEPRPTQRLRFKLAMECQLENRLESDAETFRVRQPSNWDRPQWWIRAFHQYVTKTLPVSPSPCVLHCSRIDLAVG